MRPGHDGWDETPEPGFGFLASLRASLGTWVATLKTRVEIVSTEIEEARGHLEKILLLAIGAIFFLSFGLLVLTFFVIALAWDTNYRFHVIAAFALLYIGLGVAALMAARKTAKLKPNLFATTITELDKDYHALIGAARRAEQHAAAQVEAELKREETIR